MPKFKQISQNNASLPNGIKPEHLAKQLNSVEGKFAELINRFAGSTLFVYLHVLWFGFWIIANKGYLHPLVPVFDPFPYGLLTMVVSLEAIFLSTFILIAQNRQSLLDTYRELQDEAEQEEDEKEQEELEQDVEEISQDVDEIGRDIDRIQEGLNDLIKAVTLMQSKTAERQKNAKAAAQTEKNSSS